MTDESDRSVLKSVSCTSESYEELASFREGDELEYWKWRARAAEDTVKRLLGTIKKLQDVAMKASIDHHKANWESSVADLEKPDGDVA